MKRSRKVLNWIAGLFLLLVVVLVIVIATFDWNRLKPFVNDKVSQAIGRPFAINGDLSVAWRREPSESSLRALVPWPEFIARDVSIGNPDWAAQRQFAQLDSLRIQLSPLPLFAHRIVIPSVQLGHPVIDLERDKQSRATWDFTLPQSDQPSTWQLDLREIGFDRGHISLDDAANAIKLQLAVEPLKQAISYDQLVAQQPPEQHANAPRTSGKPVTAPAGPKVDTSYMFGWQAQGQYKGTPIKGDGKIGGTLALQQDNRPFPLQAEVHIGDTHIALIGTLVDPMHLGALDLRLRLSGSSMAKLYPITGVTLPDTSPYATDGHLITSVHRQGSRYSYRDFHGHVGNSDLAGNLLYVTGGDRAKLSGDLHSKLLQFADLAPLIGADSNAEKQQRGDGTSQPADKVLPVEPFRTDRWKSMDADVTFTGARIVRGKSLPIESLSTHLVMNAGVLQLDPLNFDLAGGNMSNAIRLDGSRTPMQGRLNLHARHLKLKQLFPNFGPMSTSFGEINGDAVLSAHGNSVAALLGTSNGELKLLMNDGAISKSLLEIAGLNVGNYVVGKIFGDNTVKINCAASDFVATNGLFDARLFVFDTQDAVINVTGNANMATEKLDLDIVPHTKGFRIFSLRSPLYVQGTMKNPSVGVHTGPLLIRAGGAVALTVVAAPAAALLALVSPSHDNGDQNTCRDVLQQMKAPSKIDSKAKLATKK